MRVRKRSIALHALCRNRADPARDLIFLPTAGPTAAFYGGERPGDDLYTSSVVALRASTGEVVWHFQTTHHDVWDYDVAAQPTLATLRRDGREIPAVLIGTKMGFVFALERETGKPIFPIEERPVPTSDVPGEQLSPTQPIPLSPPPLVPQSRLLTTGMPEAAYRRLRLVAKIFPAYYRFRHKISDRRLENDRTTVSAALDRIERERDGRAYLVSTSFTVADLTAASLLSPLLQPPEIQYPLRVELPPDIQDYRAELLRHPAARWALDIYRQHRGSSMEVRRKAQVG